MKSIVFILLTIPFALESATLRGKVSDWQTHEPIVGAPVNLVSTTLGATTDRFGYFEIDSIPVGKYVVQANYIGYHGQRDTIIMSSKNEVQELNISLSGGKTLSELVANLLTPAEANEIKIYQDSLTALSLRENLLSLAIDSLYCNTLKEYNGELMATLSFHNNTALPLFVFKNYPSLMRISPSIIDSRGDTLRKPFIFFDPQPPFLYDSSDLIKLSPEATVQYPTTIVWLWGCSGFPYGKYSVRIIYSYQQPQSFGWLWGIPNKSTLLCYLKAVQGKYISSNQYELINKVSRKK